MVIFRRPEKKGALLMCSGDIMPNQLHAKAKKFPPPPQIKILFLRRTELAHLADLLSVDEKEDRDRRERGAQKPEEAGGPRDT